MIKVTWRVIRVMAVIGLLAVAALLIIGRNHVYHGPKTDPPKWDSRADRLRVVEEGRKLIGVWYDPFQGYMGNIGGRMGMIVCMDVPVIAYRNAGASVRRLLEDDYKAHPEHYDRRDGSPGDPFFERRARNLYTYCSHNGCLDMTGPPEPGDVVFMSKSRTGGISHIALVTSVEGDGRYKVVESSRDEWYVTRELYGEKMLGRGWVFRGFGCPLRHRAKEA
jgi:uncharacterized protein YijF (DUF1287 family)